MSAQSVTAVYLETKITEYHQAEQLVKDNQAEFNALNNVIEKFWSMYHASHNKAKVFDLEKSPIYPTYKEFWQSKANYDNAFNAAQVAFHAMLAAHIASLDNGDPVKWLSW